MDRLIESALVVYHPASSRDQLVASLDSPWIADEGPLSIGLRQHHRGEAAAILRARGLAFDNATTIFWDEDGVQVVSRNASEEGILAFQSSVVLREYLTPRPASLARIDYLRSGVLLGSRYLEILVQEAQDA